MVIHSGTITAKSRNVAAGWCEVNFDKAGLNSTLHIH